MLLMGKIKAYSQTNTGSTYFSKATIDYSNLKINTIATASQISNQIRAFCFRDYQLPTFEGFDIFYAIPTLERSLCKPGVILENNDQYIKLSTIDYNVLLYKDKLNELINHCKNGNLAALRNQEDLPLYIDEREKEHGWNMLMVATYFNRKDIVSYLLSIGADVNSQNYNGTTVLMYAKDASIKSNDFSILFYLLEHGGNLFARDYSGKRLLDYVRQESDELYFLFKKYHD